MIEIFSEMNYVRNRHNSFIISSYFIKKCVAGLHEYSNETINKSSVMEK